MFAGLKRNWRNLSFILTVFILVVSSVTTLLALRSNNLRMQALYQEVLEADKEDGDIETALKNLRHHVLYHMNASLTPANRDKGSEITSEKPLRLAYEYFRDNIQAYKEFIAQVGSPAQIKTLEKTIAFCQDPINDLEIEQHLVCVTNYLSSKANIDCLENHETTPEVLTCVENKPDDVSAVNDFPQLPNDILTDPDIYKFDFKSPAWTPDLAGISLVIVFVTGAITLIRLATPRIKI